jgi:argininosuccinate lyase
LLNEFPDSQSLDSQTLASEVQHLMEEQQQSAITERENYELLLGLTKLKKEAKKTELVSNEDEEELELNLFKKSS